MKEKRRGTVILDLDGTLVDSAPDLADSLDLLLREHGLAPVGLDGTRKLIGHGISSLVKRGMAARGLDLSPAALEEAASRFRTLYGQRLPAKASLYPGVEAGLARLETNGWRLVVCTNKIEAFARSILDGLGVLDRFELIAGPDTFGFVKPDPAHLLSTLPVERRDGHVAVMVGDSEVDIAAAKAAGIPIVAVSYGYSHVPLQTLHPAAVVDSFTEVPAAVERVVGTARATLEPQSFG